MKAVVWHGVGDIRMDDVPEPKIKEPMGTMTGVKQGTIPGHGGVGIVEQAGKDIL